jgi:feruloyl-CoA synthase
MLAANLQMITQALPYLGATPPVIVDWLPWNHTFGGNHNYGLVMYHGGTLYIDEGRPLPGAIDQTARNSERHRTDRRTSTFRAGMSCLLRGCVQTRTCVNRFFSRLGMLFYAGAGLSQPVWDAYEEMAVETLGERILWVTGLGRPRRRPRPPSPPGWRARRHDRLPSPA